MDAGGNDIAIDDLSPFTSHFTYRAADPLNAEAALLHDAAATHRHIGILLGAQCLWPYGLPEVEEPHVPWIVVGAEPCADAPVVDLDVQTFIVVICSEHGADRLTRCVLTVLAEHRHKPGLHIRELAFPVPLNANPLDCAALQEMVGLIDGDVVLRLT